MGEQTCRRIPADARNGLQMLLRRGKRLGGLDERLDTRFQRVLPAFQEYHMLLDESFALRRLNARL